MALRCELRKLRLFGEDDAGVYRDTIWRCMKPTCEDCWKLLLNVKAIATRIALTRLGYRRVWVGLLKPEDRTTARHWKHRHQKDNVRSMLATYMNSDKVGVIATHNMVPSRDVMEEVSLNDAIYRWVGWGLENRPKRVGADWDLEVPAIFRGKFHATEAVISRMWEILDSRYGYKPGDVPDDGVVFERRMYDALREIREAAEMRRRRGATDSSNSDGYP